MMASPVLVGLFFPSGAVALTHEVVWIRKLTLVFGVPASALSIVLAAFFGGMAPGAWLVGRRYRSHPHPARVYAWLEAGIGVWDFLFPALLGVADGLYARLGPACGERSQAYVKNKTGQLLRSGTRAEGKLFLGF